MSRFIKFFLLDIKEGLRRTWLWWLLSAIAVFFLAFSFFWNAATAGEENLAPQLTMGDYFFNLTAGGSAFNSLSSTPFELPISWFVPLLLLAYITLWYPYRDLMGSGKAMMIASGSRWSWWLAKCAWIIVCVVSYCLIALVVTVVFALIARCDKSLHATFLATMLLRFQDAVNVDLASYNIVSFLRTVPIGICALCLLQLTISLVARPLWGYVTTVSILFISAFIEHPLLLGSNLMAIRSTAFAAHGITSEWSVGLGVAITLLSIFLGGYFLTKTDILEKEA